MSLPSLSSPTDRFPRFFWRDPHQRHLTNRSTRVFYCGNSSLLVKLAVPLGEIFEDGCGVELRAEGVAVPARIL
jgi:hypothetical protein